MSMQAVIDRAVAELGVHEDPAGSNVVKYWDYYDPAYQGQPWCCSFLWCIFQWAGERMAFFGGGQTASCGKLLRWYKEQGLTVPIQQARMGDIGIYNFSGTTEPEHCGLITGVKTAITTVASLTSIEGNTTTSNGSESNGGIVAEKTRFPKNVVAICRPQYKGEDPVPVDDITGHWVEENWRWAEEIGIIHGYPDGSRKPDQNATRAEIVTMLKRYDDYRFGGSGR